MTTISLNSEQQTQIKQLFTDLLDELPVSIIHHAISNMNEDRFTEILLRMMELEEFRHPPSRQPEPEIEVNEEDLQPASLLTAEIPSYSQPTLTMQEINKKTTKPRVKTTQKPSFYDVVKKQGNNAGRDMPFAYDRQKTQHSIVLRALDTFNGWKSGSVPARRIKMDKKMRVLDVGKRWRLVSRDDGCEWQLLSHANYDKVVQTINR